MIRYSLECADGHCFESWFPSSASYEDQRARGFVTCPQCGSSAVEKAIMAPAVARTDRPERPDPRPEPPLAGDRPASGDGTAAPPLAMAAHPEAELRELLRQVREHVVKSSDYVGDAFADLARKMHDGEIEHRSIYGEASPEEVKALKEDEVEIFPLPILPEERN